MKSHAGVYKESVTSDISERYRPVERTEAGSKGAVTGSLRLTAVPRAEYEMDMETEPVFWAELC